MAPLLLPNGHRWRIHPLVVELFSHQRLPKSIPYIAQIQQPLL
ncbi:hypothetical protein PPECC9_2680 [Escherichia coli PCN009]|jgi:hypothetical protein|nr:hypothetical protein EC2875150_1228 [Escherichia coli 2875150]OAF98227.1 hypothetical protein PPECC9_2680 [Escherichia coli PCN009]